MKKYASILFIAILFVFQSCKKDYTCTCDLTYSNSQPAAKKERILVDVTKRNAQKICVDYVEDKTSYTITADCSLK